MPEPIALFTYNRPEHTRLTLETLAANPLAAESRLTVFSDGPRAGDEERVAAVRRVLRERAWCGEMRIVEAVENRGLAASIVSGVTELLRENERLIVLEDDLHLSPGFLAYMNDALALYAEEPRVMSVSAWLPPLTLALPETFFMRTGSSWGWATWRRAWAHFQPDAASLARQLERGGQLRAFNLEGGYDYFQQLRLNAEGRLKTWAVLWYASIFLADGLNLHPRRSLVKNIGHDGSGAHSLPDARFGHEQLADRIKVERVPLVSHPAARAAFRRGLRGPLSVRLGEKFRRMLRRLRAPVSLGAASAIPASHGS